MQTEPEVECDCVNEDKDSCESREPKDSYPFFCTRPKGHTGKHRACGSEHNLAEWE